MKKKLALYLVLILISFIQFSLIAGDKFDSVVFHNQTFCLKLSPYDMHRKSSDEAKDINKNFYDQEIQDYYYCTVCWDDEIQGDNEKNQQKNIIVGPYTFIQVDKINKKDLPNYCCILKDFISHNTKGAIFRYIIIPRDWLMENNKKLKTVIYGEYNNIQADIILRSNSKNKEKMRTLIEKSYQNIIAQKDKDYEGLQQTRRADYNRQEELLNSKQGKIKEYEKRLKNACFYRNVFGFSFFACTAIMLSWFKYI